MKYRLMDLLACPMCRNFPLKLHVIEEEVHSERKLEERAENKPLCELYCAFKGEFIKNLKEPPPCEECIKREIKTAVIYCDKCGRWYPVIEYIPHMLPDYIREEEKDREMEFLKKYAEKIPDRIKYGGQPHNLSSTRPG